MAYRYLVCLNAVFCASEESADESPEVVEVHLVQKTGFKHGPAEVSGVKSCLLNSAFPLVPFLRKPSTRPRITREPNQDIRRYYENMPSIFLEANLLPHYFLWPCRTVRSPPSAVLLRRTG